MTKKRTRRIRSPHPGVKLKKRTLPSGRVSWRAHFHDPDQDREVALTLLASTAEARRTWAIEKSRQLARTLDDRAAGILAPCVGPRISEAVRDYLEYVQTQKGAATAKVYRTAVKRFEAWASKHRIARTSDLRPPNLAHLQEHLQKVPRSGKRGKQSGDGYRGAVTVNGELRAIKTMLSKWRRKGLTPHLTSDSISDGLPRLREHRKRPSFLKEAQIGQLLRAALRHDAECFVETREEHRGDAQPGSTPRYLPIAPFAAFLLLSGCRRNEALSLRWDRVDLDTRNRDGHKVGVIALRAVDVKTRVARDVQLEVSPQLRKILAALKLRGRGAHVFGGEAPYSPSLVHNARVRLMKVYGAPDFTWKDLRSTCATYLTNSPGIFGGASVFLSAKQLGHSVTVAERRYVGVHRGIPPEAKTLEDAMVIRPELRELVTAVSSGGTTAAAV